MRTLVVIALLILLGEPLHAQNIQLYAENAPPNAYIENNTGKGRTIEIVQAVLKEIGMENTKISIVPWTRGYASLSSDKNAALFPTARTKQREHLFKWAGKVMPNTIYLYRLKSRKDIKVNSLPDIKKYRLGTMENDVKDQLLSKYNKNISHVDQDIQNVHKALFGRIDLFPYASLRFNYELTKAGIDPKQFEKVFLLESISVPQYLAFNIQTEDHVVEKFKKGFASITEKGIWQKILDKWE